MIVRKLRLNEVDELRFLFKHSDFNKYKQELIEDINDKVRDIFVMIDNEKIIGEITVYYKNRTEIEIISGVRVYLAAYRIMKEYQGKGIGQSLLENVIGNLEEQGYTEFTIGVEDENAKAMHIYEKFGFNELLTRLSEKYDDNVCEYNLYLRKSIDKKIDKLIKRSGLGDKILSVSRVTGGLSHRMYKVVTNKGIYAVKELNQGIMKKKDSYSNFVFAEKVTDIVKRNGIRAVGAIKVNGNFMQNIDNDFFMIFDWTEGKVLSSDEITEKHCAIIGEILAKIHNIDFSEIEDNERKKVEIEDYDWRVFCELAKKANKKYTNVLQENCNLLYELNNKVKEAITEYAKQNLIISHTDLDRKNVMWQGNEAYIIDWEASGYINPTIELIQVAWYWSGGDVESIDYDKFRVVVNTYKKYVKKSLDENIEKLIYADIYGGLAWINYNLKRSLCLENTYNQEEIELAEKEIVQSIDEIKYNISQIDNMISIFKNI